MSAGGSKTKPPLVEAEDNGFDRQWGEYVESDRAQFERDIIGMGDEGSRGGDDGGGKSGKVPPLRKDIPVDSDTDDGQQPVEVELAVPHCSSTTSATDLATLVPLDPVVLHSLRLQMYLRAVAEAAAESPTTSALLNKLPEQLHQHHRRKLWDPLPDLSKVEAHDFTKRACAALSAHSGFEDAESEALEILTDVAKERLTLLCERLKVFHDRRINGRESAFASAAQQMLQSVDLEVLDLRDYYQRSISGRRDALLTECTDLIQNLSQQQQL